ncbi:MAG: SPFH domain-containing protein [Clostridia bacterium]|nr:SPFH domain-containing protein [Clostridia bacterium]
MGFFKKKVGIIADVIRCDEPTYLIWKWHPNGTKLGEHKREISIRTGSKLRVKDGEVAVFVYKQKDRTMQDYVVGPYEEKIKTANLPVLTSILGAFYGGDTPFQAEIYFINLANIIQTKIVVPYFDVCDPRYPDFAVPVAVRGTISFKINDYKEFIKLHRLDSFSLDDFQNQIRDTVSRYVKDTVANAPTTHNIPVVKIEARTSAINDIVEEELREKLKKNFGVIASAIDIGIIEIDKSSSGYRELVEITTDITSAYVKAQTEANIENYAENLRIQREEEQYAKHMQTKSANLGAYQIEKQAEVGIAGAEALGQMGANNAGNVDLGGNGGMGFNPAAMMASMAVGGVVGQNIASVMNGAMSGNGYVATPPPVPTVVYNVAKDGKPTGPYDIAKLTEMIASGELLPDSLVWSQGMANWEKANTIDELKELFSPPII